MRRGEHRVVGTVGRLLITVGLAVALALGMTAGAWAESPIPVLKDQVEVELVPGTRDVSVVEPQQSSKSSLVIAPTNGGGEEDELDLNEESEDNTGGTSIQPVETGGNIEPISLCKVRNVETGKPVVECPPADETGGSGAGTEWLVHVFVFASWSPQDVPAPDLEQVQFWLIYNNGSVNCDRVGERWDCGTILRDLWDGATIIWEVPEGWTQQLKLTECIKIPQAIDDPQPEQIVQTCTVIIYYYWYGTNNETGGTGGNGDTGQGGGTGDTGGTGGGGTGGTGGGTGGTGGAGTGGAPAQDGATGPADVTTPPPPVVSQPPAPQPPASEGAPATGEAPVSEAAPEVSQPSPESTSEALPATTTPGQLPADIPQVLPATGRSARVDALVWSIGLAGSLLVLVGLAIGLHQRRLAR